MTRVPSSLPTWTTGTFGSQYLLQTFALMVTATTSVNPELQSPRFRCGEPLAKTPFLLNYKTRSNSHSVALEDTSTSTVTLSPAPLFWANRPPWKNPHNASSESPPRLPTSMLKDLTRRRFMYVGAASQHVLRVSFVPEQEAKNIDMEVTAFWSQLILRDATSPSFFLPLMLGGLGMAQLVSGMQLHHGPPGNRSSQHSWPPFSPRTQTLFSTLLHNSGPNLFNFKPQSHCR